LFVLILRDLVEKTRRVERGEAVKELAIFRFGPFEKIIGDRLAIGKLSRLCRTTRKSIFAVFYVRAEQTRSRHCRIIV